MQRFSKNSIIAVICVGLFSLLLIEDESKKTDNVIHKKMTVSGSSTLKQVNQEQTRVTENKQAWTDEQLIARLNIKDPLLTLQTLSYLWVNIEGYSKKKKIMTQVSDLAKHPNDRRISELASLLSGQLVQRSSAVVDHAVMTNDEWEMMEQNNLLREESQSESDNEKQAIAFNGNDMPNLVDSEEQIQYIDQLLTHKNELNINKFNSLIIDPDEEVSVAAADALINYLHQGIGNQDRIVEILKENIALLDDLQIQSVKEILERSSTMK